MADGSLPPGPQRPTQGGGLEGTKDLLAKLDQVSGLVGQSDPALAKTINALVQAGQKPGQLDDQVFRTRLAYAVQDVERHSGPISLTGPLRDEMTKLAGSYPGLQHDRVQDLLRNTGAIEDRGLIRDIRKLAADTAGLGPAQQTAAVDNRADALDSRLRLDRGAPASAQGGLEQRDQLRASPGSGQQPAPSSGAAATGPQAAAFTGAAASTAAPPGGAQQAQRVTSGPSVFDRLLSAVSGADDKLNSMAREAWDRAPTPMGPRHSDFREAMQVHRDEKVLKAAEVAGSAALEAMRAFANGPGHSVMARIQEAAKSDPEGLKGVLSEMRAGGRYEGLRQQLQGEQALTKGFAEGFERAAAAVGAYGRQRGAADEVGSRRGEMDQVASRFQQLDHDVGQRASALPGPKEGKSMIDELGEKVKEVVIKAIDAVKAMFSSFAGKNASAAASPSPAA